MDATNTLDQIAQWEPVVVQLVGLGVKSFVSIRALMQDAGVDSVVIAALEPKYDVLVDDVKRAAAGG